MFGPVVLLIAAINLEVLLKCLIGSFCLAIPLWMISGGEVEAHVESFTERPEEVRNKLGAPVGGDMGWNSVLGEDVDEEQLGESCGGDGIMSWDEDTLFGESVDYHEDGGIALRRRKLFDEVHGDGVPWLLRNRKLLQETIRTMTRSLRTSTGCTGANVVFYESPDLWPCIFATNELQGTILSEMSCSRMVMKCPEYTESEVISFWDIDAIVLEKESFGVDAPTWV